MADLALGGVLDDWSFGFTVLSSLGTLAAVILALELARRAGNRQHEEYAKTRLVKAMQVVAVYRQGVRVGGQELFEGPLVEVYNGSGEAITDVRLALTLTLPSEEQGRLIWSWNGGRYGGVGGNAPYISHGQRTYFSGGFKSSELVLDHGRLPTNLSSDLVRIVLRWRDGLGQRWERDNNGRPVPE